MPTDIAYPFRNDAGGDIQTVSGREFYQQHAGQLAALAVDTPRGGPLTANQTTEITSQVTQVLRNSPHFQSPRVTVTAVDGDSETITVRVDPLSVTPFLIELDGT